MGPSGWGSCSPTQPQGPAPTLVHFAGPKSPCSGLKTPPGKLLGDPPLPAGSFSLPARGFRAPVFQGKPSPRARAEPGPELVIHAGDSAFSASAPSVTLADPRGGLAGRKPLAPSHRVSVFAQEAPRTHPPKNNSVTNPPAPIVGPSLSPSDIFPAAQEGPQRGCGIIWFPRQTPGSRSRGFGSRAGTRGSAGTHGPAGAPSHGGARSPRRSQRGLGSWDNDFLPAVILAEKTFVHLLHHAGQHRAGVVRKVQVPDLGHRHGDDGESFFVFLSGARAQLGSNGEGASHRQGSADHVPPSAPRPR